MPCIPCKDEAYDLCISSFSNIVERGNDGKLYLFGKDYDNIDDIFHHSSMCNCCNNHSYKPKKLIHPANSLEENWWNPAKPLDVCIDGCECMCARTCAIIYNFKLFHILKYHDYNMSDSEEDTDDEDEDLEEENEDGDEDDDDEDEDDDDVEMEDEIEETSMMLPLSNINQETNIISNINNEYSGNNQLLNVAQEALNMVNLINNDESCGCQGCGMCHDCIDDWFNDDRIVGSNVSWGPDSFLQGSGGG